MQAGNADTGGINLREMENQYGERDTETGVILV